MLPSFPSCFPQMSSSGGPHPDFQFATAAHGPTPDVHIHKSVPHFGLFNKTSPSSLGSLALSHSLSLTHLCPSLTSSPRSAVPNCPPSHLSCNVYGPFCFCVLMTTVTESQPLPMRPDERCYPDAGLTPPCPWPQRCRLDREGEE